MEYSANLARLPENVTFPERLRDRVSFDEATQRLTYRGFMTKCTYDELSALSDDIDYHRALEQLFVRTSDEVAPHDCRRMLPAAIGLASVVAVLLILVVVWIVMGRSSGSPQASPSDVTHASSPAR